MALDSLLASLKRGVSEVAEVQASHTKDFACYPVKLSGVAEVSENPASTPVATHVTPRNPSEVSPTPAPLEACTLKTPVTPEIVKEGMVAPEVGAGGTAISLRWWLKHYADRNPVEVACSPEPTHAEMLEHADAIAAGPFMPTARLPAAPMTAEEEHLVRAWLALIEETDPATIAEVLHQCQHDDDARDYFIRRSAKLPTPAPFPEDRRTCTQCANLVDLRCVAAMRGEVVGSRNYKPIRDMLKRCEGYAPGADDPDQRHGRERWLGLIHKGDN